MPFLRSLREPGIHALHVALGIACGGVHTEQEGAAWLAALYVKYRHGREAVRASARRRGWIQASRQRKLF